MSIEIHDKENKTYIVLGASRSATSFISKMLEDAGVKMGNNNGNFYENKDFLRLNRKILTEAGKGERFPSEKDILRVREDRRIKRLINKYKDKFWGWKDPRTSLTVKKYLPHLEGDVYLICCFRKPDRVIESHIRGNPKFSRYRRYLRRMIDIYNRSIIRAVESFCGLNE